MHKYLVYTNQVMIADEALNEEEAGPYSNLKTAICGVINLFMEKYEEDFGTASPTSNIASLK